MTDKKANYSRSSYLWTRKNVSDDFYDAFNEEVAELLDDAERAEADDWKTVQPRDL